MRADLCEFIPTNINFKLWFDQVMVCTTLVFSLSRKHN